jgi:PEP-CTERM motif
MKNSLFSCLKQFGLALAFILGCWGNANAVPTLTAAAVTDGFGLSKFADNFPTTGFCCGPLGIAFLPGGGVMVSDFPGNVRVFPTDVDGQHANLFPAAQNYGTNNGTGMTRIGNFVYLARQSASDVVRLNLDGTFNSTVTTISSATGVYANPVTHKLYVSDCCSGTGIWEVDTNTNVKTQLIGGSFDGLSVSADGGTLYAATNGHIIGYSLATMAVVFDSGFLAGGVDGTELGAGSLAGQIFAWTNSGDLWEVNLATPLTQQRTLVTGGARGDFVTADPNGSLLMVTTDEIWRLTAPVGGCIGAACDNNVPEPGSLVLMALGLLALSRVTRRTRRPT